METIGTGNNWYLFKKTDGTKVIVKANVRVEAKIEFSTKYPDESDHIKSEGFGEYPNNVVTPEVD